MLDGILQGLSTAVMPMNIMMVIVGCFVGTFIGMLPGLGPISAIALMIPITYGLDPSSGLILMAGVYYGAVFGGSTSSILINAPGCSSTVVTAFDGYPMAQKGQAGKALGTRGLLFFHWRHAFGNHAFDCGSGFSKRLIELPVFRLLRIDAIRFIGCSGVCGPRSGDQGMDDDHSWFDAIYCWYR